MNKGGVDLLYRWTYYTGIIGPRFLELNLIFITGGGRIVDPGSTIRRTDGYKSGVSEKNFFFPS